MSKDGYISRRFDKALRSLQIFVVTFALVSLSACMPSGNESVNTELFKDKEELKAKVATLKPGMKEKTVFEKLGIPAEKFEKMSLEMVQYSIYGNSQVTGSPEQLENFRKKLMRYEGYMLPYRKIKKDSSLGFGKMKIRKKGADLRVIVIFDNKKLMRASVEGSEQLDASEDQYIWSSLIRKGIGVAF